MRFQPSSEPCIALGRAVLCLFRLKAHWDPGVLLGDARITAADRPADRKLSKSLARSAQAIQQRRYLLSQG